MKKTFIYKALSISCLFAFCSGCTKGLQYEKVSYDDPRNATLIDEVWEHGIARHKGEKLSYEFTKTIFSEFLNNGTEQLSNEQSRYKYIADIDLDKQIIHVKKSYKTEIYDVNNYYSTYEEEYNSYLYIKDGKQYLYQDGGYAGNSAMLQEYTPFSLDKFDINTLVLTMERDITSYGVVHGNTESMFDYENPAYAFIIQSNPKLNSAEFKLAKDKEGCMKFKVSAYQGDLKFSSSSGRGTKVTIDATIEDYLNKNSVETDTYYFLDKYVSHMGSLIINDCPCKMTVNQNVKRVNNFTDFEIPEISETAVILCVNY